MKKNGSWILLALLFCLCIPLLAAAVHGTDLTLQFTLPEGSSSGEMRFDPKGVVQVSRWEEDPESGILRISLHAVGIGETAATLHWNELPSDSLEAAELTMTLTALRGGLLFDSLTYNFSLWTVCGLALTLFLMLLSVVLTAEALQTRKAQMFSYRPAWLLGTALFLFVFALWRFCSLLTGNAGTVWAELMNTSAAAQSFLRWTAPVLVLFSCALAFSNLELIRHEGARPANMLGIAIAVLMTVGAGIGIWMQYAPVFWGPWDLICNLYAGLFSYMECQLASVTFWAFCAGRHAPEEELDAIVILGCRIRRDGSLYPLIRGRVDRALAFARQQAQQTGHFPALIPSGGKGADEPMAEAEAMQAYLLAQGVSQEFIWPESASKTTLENMRFSRRIADAHAATHVAFCTTGYHVFRSGMLAHREGWPINGMGCRTCWYFWPNAFLREFIGLLAERWKGQVLAMAAIALVSTALTLVV